MEKLSGTCIHPFVHMCMNPWEAHEQNGTKQRIILLQRSVGIHQHHHSDWWRTGSRWRHSNNKLDPRSTTICLLFAMGKTATSNCSLQSSQLMTLSLELTVLVIIKSRAGRAERLVAMTTVLGISRICTTKCPEVNSRHMRYKIWPFYLCHQNVSHYSKRLQI